MVARPSAPLAQCARAPAIRTRCLGTRHVKLPANPLSLRHRDCRAVAVGVALVLVALLWLWAPSAAGAGRRSVAGPSAGASTGRTQPVITQAAPARRRALPFGDVTVTPTTIVAGAPHQDIRVSVRVTRS